jgi:PadR family transcriptional regulator PadR
MVSVGDLSGFDTHGNPATMRHMVLGTARLSPELSRGVVEHCVLALVLDRPTYAFEIVRALGTRGLVTSEGTIYPLLARLRRDGLVSTAWRESDAGPPRRYYEITAEGREALTTFVADWSRFREAVDALLPGAMRQEA